MYVIMADYEATGTWEYLYWQGDQDYVAHDVKCELTMGDSGSVRLSVPKSNPGYARITTRKTLLDFKVDGRSLGIFEVRECGRDMYGTTEVYAVGEMAWLFDSVQPQAEYHNQTARQFLQRLLAVHNAQCPEHPFAVGIVDVTDSNDSLYRFTNREQTLACIRDKLVKRLGGNLRVRWSSNVRYLDYVSDQTYGTESEQTVRFGENILDYSDNFTVDDICSEVVPLGARLENDKGDNSSIGNLDRRVTIESVNGGRDHISSNKLVERFGHVRTTRTWDDVTVPANLLAKARSWLETEQYERMSITVKAVDLSLSSAQFGSLRMGDRAYVLCEPFGLKASYVIRKRTYNPDNPQSDEIQLGDTKRRETYVASQVRASSDARAAISDYQYMQNNFLKSSIDNVTAMMTGARGGYKLTEYDEDGRWLADYIMDSMDKSTARVVKKVTVDGTAYSSSGINGPYETAVMANGTVLGKYIQAHSITAEQISTEYMKPYYDELGNLRSEVTQLISGPNGIEASIKTLQGDVFGDSSRGVAGLKTELESAIRVNSNQIALTVKKGEISSAINQSAEQIMIKSNKFGWESTYSSLTPSGTLTANYAKLQNATVSGNFVSGSSSGNRISIENGMITVSNPKIRDKVYIDMRYEKSPIVGADSIGLTLKYGSRGAYVSICKDGLSLFAGDNSCGISIDRNEIWVCSSPGTYEKRLYP